VLQHYVFLKYRDGTSEAHVMAFNDPFVANVASVDFTRTVRI